ncbi:MAG: hypothetical protein V2A73_07875 [Pseudomonadota bacterium]
MKTGLVAIPFAVLMAVASSAVADGGGGAPILVYWATPDCPGEAEFRARVKSRIREPHLLDLANRGNALMVVLAPGEGGIAEGLFVVVEGGLPRAGRRVSGRSCDEVATAMAFVVALTILPDEQVPSEEPTAPVEEGAAPAVETTISAQPVTPAPRERRIAHHWAAGAQVSLAGGLVPGLLVSVPLFVDVERQSSTGRALRARVGLIGTLGQQVDTEHGTAGFRLLACRVEGCPYKLALGQSFDFWPCLGLTGGGLAATGATSATVANAQESLRPWVSTEAIARMSWRPWKGLLLFEAQLEVVVPLVRDRFYYHPDTTIMQTGAVGFAGSVGLALLFL